MGRKMIMETLILIGIGLTAVIYLALIIWKDVKGQGACHCDSATFCNAKAGQCSCNTKRNYFS